MMNAILAEEKAAEEERRKRRKEKFKNLTKESCENCRYWKEAPEVGLMNFERYSRGDVPQWGNCKKKKKEQPIRFGYFTCQNFIQRKTTRRKPARLKNRRSKIVN